MDISFGIIELRSLLIGLAIFMLFLYFMSGKRYKWPAGPSGFPLLGNTLLFLKLSRAESMSEDITTMMRKYGNYMRLKLAHKNIVFISGKEAIKEGWQKKGDMFSGRPNFFPIISHLSQGKGLIMSTDLTEYRQLRKHITALLRDLGVGKKSVESKIQHEAVALADYFSQQNGEVFEMEMISTKSVANVIAAVLFGERFEYDDPEFTQLLTYLLSFFENYGTPILPYIFLPVWLGKLLTPTVGNAIKCHDGMKNFITGKINEHRKTFDSNNIRDICDVVIDGQLTPVVADNIVQTMVDLFLAGTETTSTTLQWTCLLMIRNPDVQEKCHREIVDVVGERQATLEDKKRMPYNQAVFNEVSRLGSVLPMAVLRETLCDVEMGGYSFPKGTLVAPNLNELHHDPQYWPKPNQFNPDRWLTKDEDGNTCMITPPEHFMPFNIGPRKCVGEILSRAEMFLMLVAILQRHKLVPADNNSAPELDIKEMVTRHPKTFKMRAVSW